LNGPNTIPWIEESRTKNRLDHIKSYSWISG